MVIRGNMLVEILHLGVVILVAFNFNVNLHENINALAFSGGVFNEEDNLKINLKF